VRRLRAACIRLLDPFRRRPREREMHEELESHLDLHIDDNLRAGMSPDEARRVALVKLGGLELVKEHYRDRRSFRPIDTLTQDISHALRLMRRTPGVAAIIVASLALGIGANTAMFSVLNALLLRTLPVQNPQQLAIVAESEDSDSWTYPIWEQLRDRQQAFAGAVAWYAERFSMVQDGQPAGLQGLYVNGEFFTVLGTPAWIGRTFTKDDDRRGGGPDGPVAVISYRYWQERFGGSPAAIGTTLTLDRVPFTIVGVTPPEFFGLDVGQTFDVAVPLGTEPLLRGRESWLDRHSAWWLTVMIRTRPDQTLAEAVTSLRAIQPQVREATLPTDWRPEDLKEYLHTPLILKPAATGASYLRLRYQRGLSILMAVVALVLLIACANVANLLLARASVRRHEFSVRLALGASRMRLCRQLLVESLLLASCGAALGLLLATWSSAALVRLLSTSTNTVFLDLAIDTRVVVFTTAAAVITALLFGIAPALQAARVDATDAMKEQGRNLVGHGRARLGSLLVVLQVALSLVLAVGAALFVGSLVRLTNRPLGFEVDRVLTARVQVRGDDVPVEQRAVFFERVREAAASAPGVASATASVVAPLSGMTWNLRLDPSAYPGLSDAQRSVHLHIIGPDFFKTFGTRLLAGREFTVGDASASKPVVIVNETFARKFFGGSSPIGRIVRRWPSPGEPDDAREVVGFAADAVYRDPRQAVPPTMYVPMLQHARAQRARIPPSIVISVRPESGAPIALARPLAAAIERAAPGVSVTLQPLSEQARNSVLQERLLASVSGSFGALGLLLAGLGLYGVTSYTVARRRTEMGLRMALGAAPRQVITLVLTRVFWLVLAGVACGTAAAIASARVLGSLLYGIQPGDPATLAGAIVLLSAIGLIAGLIPAWRASTIDPARVLHDV